MLPSKNAYMLTGDTCAVRNAHDNRNTLKTNKKQTRNNIGFAKIKIGRYLFYKEDSYALLHRMDVVPCINESNYSSRLRETVFATEHE